METQLITDEFLKNNGFRLCEDGVWENLNAQVYYVKENQSLYDNTTDEFMGIAYNTETFKNIINGKK